MRKSMHDALRTSLRTALIAAGAVAPAPTAQAVRKPYLSKHHPDAEGQWVIADLDTGAVLERLGEAAVDSRGLPVEGLATMLELEVVTPDDDPMGPAWEGPIGFLNTETSDGRLFQSIAWREFPLPLMYQSTVAWGHDGAMFAGAHEEAAEQGATIVGRGHFDAGDVGIEAARVVADGTLCGVSMDLVCTGPVDIEVTEYDDEGMPTAGREIYSEAEGCGVTITPHPAFADARIHIIDAEAEEVPAPVEEVEPVPEPAMAAGGPIAASGPIVVGPERFETMSTSGHIVSTSATAADSDSATWLDYEVPGGPVPIKPPVDWFEDPGLIMPTPLTIDRKGRIMGHIAEWGVCHLSHQDVCFLAPTSMTDYAYFATGELECDDGCLIPTGVVTMGGMHAPLELGADRDAVMRHYEDVSTGTADVAIGEDAHGIWVSGAVRPELTGVQMRTLRAAKPSGDWRRLRGNLELVACHMVNTPGYPVTRLRMQGDKQLALVAAAAPMQREVEPATPAFVERVMARLDTQERMFKAMRPQLLAALDARMGYEPVTRDDLLAVLDARMEERASTAPPSIR